MTPNEIAKAIYKALVSKSALEIRVLGVSDLTVLADFFIFATGNSVTHLKTLCDETERVLKENGVLPHHVEGYMSGGWVLLDYGCVVVHLFLDETRAFYAIERLWSDAVPYEGDEL